MTAATTPPSELKLYLPDFAEQDTEWRSGLPFCLWPVGEQPLLHHWLDEAVNLGIRQVRLYASDRPQAVRQAMQEATLWPLEWTVISVKARPDEPDLVTADHLPRLPKPLLPVGDGWSVLAYHRELERLWLDQFLNEKKAYGATIGIGRFANIHPSVKLIEPFWIGDEVMIGPDATVGPYALIGSRSLIAGQCVVENSRVADGTFLGGGMHLSNAFLDGPLLLNLSLRARIVLVDDFIASRMTEARHKPSLLERLTALWLYLRTPATAPAPACWPAHGPAGDLPLCQGSTVLEQRRLWLPLVWQGKLNLFGVLPRTQAQLNRLPRDWADLIEKAPCGVFSYADLHLAHSPEHGDEAMHAAYQAAVPPKLLQPELFACVRRQLALVLNHRKETRPA